MKKNLARNVMGYLVLALVLAGCGQGNWKDTGNKCLGTDWKNPKKEDLVSGATLFQGICEKGKTAAELRCKDQRLEVQCK